MEELCGWVPGIPEYYFNRIEIPRIKEYYFITERLSDKECIDFKAAFREYWMYGKWPENWKYISSRSKKAFYDYAFAVSRFCAKEIRNNAKQTD